MEIRRLNSSDAGFQAALEKLLAWESVSDASVTTTVNKILHAIKSRGDAALLEYSRQLDGLEVDSTAQLEMPLQRLEKAYQ